MVKRRKAQPAKENVSKKRKVDARFDGEEEADIRTNHPPVQGHFCPNCMQRFTSEVALQNHLDYKMFNKHHQTILRDAWRRGRMMAICEDRECCYSTGLLKEMDEHRREVHHLPRSREIHIIVNNQSVKDDLAPHQCPKCVRNFTTQKSLNYHYKNCRGKLLYKCSYCSLTFSSRLSFVSHVEAAHDPETDFKVTGLFCGKRKEREAGGKRHVERTIVVKTPHLRLMSDVFTRRMKKQLEDLLLYEVELNGHTLTRIVARTVIEKKEADGKIFRKPFETTTRISKVRDIYTIRQFIRRGQDSLQSYLTILEGTPSGFTVSEITSLTIATSPAPAFRGGCGQILDTSIPAAMRRGLYKIDGDGEGCLVDAILFSLFSKDLFKEIRSELEPDCNKETHSPSCPCYKLAKKMFDEVAGISATWSKYRGRVNLTGIGLPGGVEDVEMFDKMNPHIHVNTFIDYAGRFYQLYKSENNPSVTPSHHINLVYREGFDSRTNEIQGKSLMTI